MRVVYSDQDSTLFNGPSLFLAGPTPRRADVPSWRPEALQILEALKYEGYVYVPELSAPKSDHDYVSQVEWEYTCLNGAKHIIFWVPRDLDTMPAFTTNVEFGYYLKTGNVVYGRPDSAPKNRYLDWLYRKEWERRNYSLSNFGSRPYNSLQHMLEDVVAVQRAKVYSQPKKVEEVESELRRANEKAEGATAELEALRAKFLPVSTAVAKDKNGKVIIKDKNGKVVGRQG